MTKKKKIALGIVLVLILGGLGFGIFHVLKDNHRIKKEEALRNIPFMGIEASVIDSLYNSLSENDLKEYDLVRISEDSNFSSQNVEQKGLYYVQFANSNLLKEKLDSLNYNVSNSKGIIVADLVSSFNQPVIMEELLFDWKSTSEYLKSFSKQTGIQIFSFSPYYWDNEELNLDELGTALDSLQEDLKSEGILVASRSGLLSSKFPIIYNYVLDSVFNEKQLKINVTTESNAGLYTDLYKRQDFRLKKNSIRQLIAIEAWLKKHPIVKDSLTLDLNALSEYHGTKIRKRSFSITKGDHSLIREEKVYVYINGKEEKFINEFRKYKKSVKILNRNKLKDFSGPILIINTSDIDSSLLEDINSVKKGVFLNLKRKTFNVTIPKILLTSVSNPSYKYIARALAGGGTIHQSKLFKQETEKVNRRFLTYDKAINVGLNPDSLRQITYLINRAMGGRAFPGCEVLVAKDGEIVYEKYFGKPEYGKGTAIDANDVYDIASMTKVVATTMVAMKLYEGGHFKLDDPIKKYIPDTIIKYLPYKKHTIADITFRELLIHKSGLPSGAPIIQYMDYMKRRKVARFDALYCDQKDDSLYKVQIAEGMYMEQQYQDSMWIKLNSMFLHPNKPFKYSDVNMNLLYRLFKSIIEANKLVKHRSSDTLFNGFSQYLNEEVYNKLEMNNTMYLPRRFKDLGNIVPTEKDNFWRKQMVHGHVHDPSAALLGGVAGNAGIFSNVKDLAVLFQMLEQGGMYKGEQIFKPETIKLFASRQPNSHRGLGFNKPNLTGSTFGICDDASSNTYGHTGFTGTCVWVDPNRDLVYIFLSNRVYPKVNKRIYQYVVRKGIHNIIYKSLLD